MRIRCCISALILGMVGIAAPTRGQASVTLEQYEKGRYDVARGIALDKKAPEGSRAAAMSDLVRFDAGRAKQELIRIFSDSSGTLKRQTAEELSRYGDDRAFQYELGCVTDPNCRDYRHQAVRILGNSGDRKYCTPLAAVVREILKRNEGSKWIASPEDLADLGQAVYSLARIGDRAYWPLVIEAARKWMWESWYLVDALGFLDLPEAHTMLRDYADGQYVMISCSQSGHYVDALLALTRQNDEWAIGRYRDLLLGRDEAAEAGPRIQTADKSLCGGREKAFHLLRHRDSGLFAETVFQVAGLEPEGPWTKQAWMALGLMHPDGYGKRVFDLAVSKSRWQYVTTDRLYKAVMATDPSLNDSFWRKLGAKEIQSGDSERALVENGLGYLMFEGTGWWEGE